MSESYHDPGDRLPQHDPLEIYTNKVLTSVGELDPTLLEDAQTRLLIELGAKFGHEITQSFGTPTHPKWASGVYETDVFMSYHNGGENGHTSVGELGAGVPRNVLLIANAVNRAAGRPIYTPLMLAGAFYAAQAHDRYQLCGRTLLPEGQGYDRGDERLSAKEAQARYLEAGGDTRVAEYIYHTIMATAFNPETSTQNVGSLPDSSDSVRLQRLLGQELLAAADLLGLASPRGPLCSTEYAVESLCYTQKGRPLQTRLQEMGVNLADITSMTELFELIDQDKELRQMFLESFTAGARFTEQLTYSDRAIREACGRGIATLFPGHQETTTVLNRYTEQLQGAPPSTIWQLARSRAYC
jgi:hypothetical protein